MAAAGLAAGVVPWQTLAAQATTPAAGTPTGEDQKITQLLTLSKELCGGGTFDRAGAEQLLQLLSGDAKLASGLEELLTAAPGSLTAATPAVTSAEAEAAIKAILLYWYGGDFNNNAIENRAAVYTNLIAWQAMYTPAWTTCKVFGAWADPPTLTPQVAENG
jgi:hypothetical protein